MTEMYVRGTRPEVPPSLPNTHDLSTSASIAMTAPAGNVSSSLYCPVYGYSACGEGRSGSQETECHTYNITSIAHRERFDYVGMLLLTELHTFPLGPLTTAGGGGLVGGAVCRVGGAVCRVGGAVCRVGGAGRGGVGAFIGVCD